MLPMTGSSLPSGSFCLWWTVLTIGVLSCMPSGNQPLLTSLGLRSWGFSRPQTCILSWMIPDSIPVPRQATPLWGGRTPFKWLLPALIGSDLWGVGEGLPEGLTVICLCASFPPGTFLGSGRRRREEIDSRGWGWVRGPALISQILPESPQCEDRGL